MRALWYSRGSEVFIAAKAPQQRAARRNNQVLSKDEELEFLPEVSEAKKKEIENYCDHRAIEAVLAKRDEWNVMTAKWVLTWKWSEKGWKIKARLCLRGFQDRQEADLHRYSPNGNSGSTASPSDLRSHAQMAVREH